MIVFALVVAMAAGMMVGVQSDMAVKPAWQETVVVEVPPKPEPAVVAIAEITHGEEVNLADHAVAGKYTLFDFYSPFCPPCVRIKPQVEKLANDNPDVVLRVVNINRPNVRGIDWRSPVAQQYQIQSVPQFKVYDKEGKLLHEGRAASHWLNEELKKLR